MMPLDLALVGLMAVGHFSLLIAVLNWSHGLGITSRGMEPLAAVLMGTLGLLSLGGFAYLLGIGSGSWPAPVWAYAVVCASVSLVALPAITVARRFRRRPEGLRSHSTWIDLAGEEARDALIPPGRRGWLLRLPGNESLALERTEFTLPCAELPEALDGAGLLHLTDLHFSRAYDRRFFERVAGIAAEMPADLVLLTGDFLDDDACLDWIAPVLGRWRDQAGCYAVLGNHDLHHQPRRVAGALETAGFRVLNGTWDVATVRGSRIAVGGTLAPWGRPLEGVAPEADWRLVLSHTPDRIYELSRRGVDLVLSGHNHGGQVRLPVIGPVLMPSLYGRRLDQGFFQVGRTVLHVSRGIGAKHPLRLGCPPQISRIVLRSTSAALRDLEEAPRFILRPR